MWISRYVCLFMIYSFMGWIYETAFCTIKKGKWENRGFLYGPVCPIYGTGALAASVIVKLTLEKGIEPEIWQIFIISVIGSAVLEYVTAWALEKLFHAAWWDYSKLPLNIKGRISLFTSLGFGCGGLLLYYVIVPFTVNIVSCIPPVLLEFLALLFSFLFAVDLTLTVTSLLHFDRLVVQAEDSFNRSMENIVDTTVQQSNRIRERIIQKRHSINEQINMLNGFAKGTVKRINSFRDGDDQRKAMKNTILLKLRNVSKRNVQSEETDKNE